MTAYAENIIKRKRTRFHRCEPDGTLCGIAEEGDRWRCPVCRRRWLIVFVADPPVDDGGMPLSSHYPEGVTIEGPDGSVYWRSTWIRFLGRINV